VGTTRSDHETTNLRIAPEELFAGKDSHARTLFATAETAAAIAEAGSLAFLVGGYDGSGNFGDVLMLDAALELLAPLEPELLVLPVLERQFSSHHPELAEQMIRPPRHQVFFDPEGTGEDDLVPVAAGPGLSSAISYFYGGGYFNGLWGDRKLAMMRAAEALLAAAEPAEIRRVGSGLQVEAAWLDALSPEDTALLRAFELLGTRDPRSREALAGFGSAIVPESGDDAVGALSGLRPSEPPGEGPLRVNLHFTEHDWVTSEPQQLLDFYAMLLAELGKRLDRPVVGQPLIAYLDPRVDERPAAERLGAALSKRGIEVREPVVLRPAGLGRAAAEMGAASFTMACSYHAALTSLMLGLPTLAVAHNPYYEQKTAGLFDAFGQPEEFAIRPGADPRACARLLVATALDPEAGTRLRVQLALDGRRMRRLRAAAEADLFAKIAGRVSPVAVSSVTDLSAEPGELSFTFEAGSERRRVSFRTDTPVLPAADGVLAAALMPAMSRGGELRLEVPISARILRNQREFQAIQRLWSSRWPSEPHPLQEVEVSAPSRLTEGPGERGRVATFFSGGVDSWAAILDNPEVSDLIFVRGLDLVPGWPQHVALADEVEARLREAADELGLPLHVVETDVRTLSDPLLRWESYCPSVQAAIALFFEPLFERVLIASDTEYGRQSQVGASWQVDHLWSSEGLTVEDWGGRFGRVERLRRIVDHPLVQRTLRVCWLNPDGAYNCGSCGKCLLTMIALEAIGAREKILTFPELDLGSLDGYSISTPLQVNLWDELLEATRQAGRRDLEEPVAAVVESGRRALGGPEQELQVVLDSSSWRLTKPLRRLGRLRRR
jgi:hypothetical protein